MSSAGDSEKFERTDAKLHVPVVTLSTKDSANLRKQLNEGFKRTVYLNSYKKTCKSNWKRKKPVQNT